MLKIRKSRYVVIKQHAILHKTESAMIIQIKIDRISLTAFLNKARVPGIKSPACQCNWARKTTVHVIAHCLCFVEIRHQIADSRTDQVNIKNLISSSKGVHRLAR